MSARGDYRAVYSVLYDSDEYKRLSKDAKLLWHGVKHCCGLAGIDVVYDDALAERSGLEQHEVEPARRELVREGWIQVEGRVHWLINGLRFEPNITLSNRKHREGVERHLRGLPKLSVVSRMAERYGLANPFPGLSNGNGEPSDTHPIAPRITETLTLAVDVDGACNGDERGSSRARGSATPDVETPDFDGYQPTDGQRARAAELHVDLEPALRKWRGTRKAAGAQPLDLVADFDAWLEREPAYANGNGAHPPADTGVVKRWDPPPAEDPGPPATAEAREAGRALVREVLAATSSTPEPRKRRKPLSREEQLAIARGELARAEST